MADSLHGLFREQGTEVCLRGGESAKKTGLSMDTETMTRVLDGIGAMFGI